ADLRYEIEAAGRLRHVTVELATGGDAAGGYDVLLDGRPYHVDAFRIDAHTWSIILDRARVQDAVVVADPAARGWLVHVDGVRVAAATGGHRGGRDGATVAVQAGAGQVAAPMPGRVVRLLVEVGDVVQAGQPVAIVEAMKMENELRAGRDGTVAAVRTSVGATVEAGAVLVLLQ
ncbi:MAG: acetyl-CoA carboxylase biotin carboxyl carrier protein subunit, partial [Acidobacteriota bacterium]